MAKTTKASATKSRKPTKRAAKSKVCTCCEERLKLDQFGAYARNSDGLRNYCKPCVAWMREQRIEAAS